MNTKKSMFLTLLLALIQIVVAVLVFTSCTPDKPIVLTPQPTHSPSSTATVIFHVR